MISFQVKLRPCYSVMDNMHGTNSVNPKTLGHGNTELSVEQSTKSVETKSSASKLDDDIVRTAWKHAEIHRNDGFAHSLMCGNSLREGYRYLFVPEHFRLVEH